MSRLAELNLARRPRLPVILAAEAAECGLACLTMVARFHGHDIDLNGLRQRFALSLSGASLGSLMRLADALALSGRAEAGHVALYGREHGHRCQGALSIPPTSMSAAACECGGSCSI